MTKRNRGHMGLSTESIGNAHGFSRGVPDQLRWYVVCRNVDDYMPSAEYVASRFDAPRAMDCAGVDQKRLLAWQSKTH